MNEVKFTILVYEKNFDGLAVMIIVLKMFGFGIDRYGGCFSDGGVLRIYRQW